MEPRVIELKKFKSKSADSQNDAKNIETVIFANDLYTDITCFAKQYGDPEDAKSKECIDTIMTTLFTRFTGVNEWITLYELHLIIEKVGKQRERNTFTDAIIELIYHGRFRDNDENH